MTLEEFYQRQLLDYLTTKAEYDALVAQYYKDLKVWKNGGKIGPEPVRPAVPSDNKPPIRQLRPPHRPPGLSRGLFNPMMLLAACVLDDGEGIPDIFGDIMDMIFDPNRLGKLGDFLKDLGLSPHEIKSYINAIKESKGNNNSLMVIEFFHKLIKLMRKRIGNINCEKYQWHAIEKLCNLIKKAAECENAKTCEEKVKDWKGVLNQFKIAANEKREELCKHNERLKVLMENYGCKSCDTNGRNGECCGQLSSLQRLMEIACKVFPLDNCIKGIEEYLNRVCWFPIDGKDHWNERRDIIEWTVENQFSQCFFTGDEVKHINNLILSMRDIEFKIEHGQLCNIIGPMPSGIRR